MGDKLILLVLPILVILMFDLGLTLNIKDFKELIKKPKALILGTIGQIIILPAIAFAIATIFKLEPIFYIGLILISCSPGGSSSNIFSKIAGGNVALSVTLTAISSIITIFTIPIVLSIAISNIQGDLPSTFTLPVGNLLVQNILLMLVPIILGFIMQKFLTEKAKRIDKVLSKIAFPALMLLAGIFFIQHHDTILGNFTKIGGATTALLIVSIITATLLCLIIKTNIKERKTIVIEVGMQNAAQAITLASSPFIFGNSQFAIPAIIYALMMNIVLLIYVTIVKKKD